MLGSALRRPSVLLGVALSLSACRSVHEPVNPYGAPLDVRVLGDPPRSVSLDLCGQTVEPSRSSDTTQDRFVFDKISCEEAERCLDIVVEYDDRVVRSRAFFIGMCSAWATNGIAHHFLVDEEGSTFYGSSP